MIYDFQCSKCQRKTIASIPMSEYDSMKRNVKCCDMPMEPVISGGRGAFMREPFPKGTEITEHCMNEPVFCKDKAQLKDICAETNSVSRFIEDDV